MSLSSTDPKILMGQAKCFACLTPHQQLQVQTYLLAKAGNMDTSAGGVRAMAVAATCYSCLTIVQLRRIKQYLFATWLGLDTSLAGLQAAVKAAACFTCLTPKHQQTVDTYLLAVSAGAGTDVAGVRAIESAAKCFACLDTKQQYEVQVYLLVALSNSTATSPADLMAAAKCYVQCLPFEIEQSLQASLLTQVAGRSTPPCITPTAPFVFTPLANGNTSLGINWKPLTNTGTLITGYIVYWGTSSGVYTNNSGLVSVANRPYIVTGLASGTTYFFVVVAQTNIPGCVSANSNEVTGTTSGSAANGLLNNLISYWKYDALSGADSQGSNNVTLAGGVLNASGIINSAFGYAGAGSSTINPCPANMQLGAGKSFTISTWMFGGGGASQEGQIGQFSGVAATSAWIVITPAGSSNLTLAGWTGAVQATLAGIGVLTNAWHHLVFGFDSPNKQLFAFFDGGAKQTVGTTGDLNGVPAAYETGLVTGQAQYGGSIDETGFWNRVLSATDVANLFNGGAGLPFGSFTT